MFYKFDSTRFPLNRQICKYNIYHLFRGQSVCSSKSTKWNWRSRNFFIAITINRIVPVQRTMWCSTFLKIMYFSIKSLVFVEYEKNQKESKTSDDFLTRTSQLKQLHVEIGAYQGRVLHGS